jgi:hypothetical protein
MAIYTLWLSCPGAYACEDEPRTAYRIRIGRGGARGRLDL